MEAKKEQTNNIINDNTNIKNRITREQFKQRRLQRYEELFDFLGLNNTYVKLRFDEKNNSEKYTYIYFDEKNKKLIKQSLYNITSNELYPYLKEEDVDYKFLKKNKNDESWKIGDFQKLYSVLKDLYKFKNRVVDELMYDIDFRQKEKIKLEVIEQEHNDLRILKITKNNVDIILNENGYEIDAKKYLRYLKIYKEVFPNFVEYLNFLTYILFDSGRKESFVYINAPSNWGKSFLMGVFNELGVGLEVVAASLEKRPSPLTAKMFENKINLFIDEFKVFKHDYKMLTDHFNLESKNKDEVQVPLFLKTFISAEFSTSFEDGVDEQITNRVLVYDYNTNKTKLLKDYVFNELNIDKKEFKFYIKLFIKRYLTKKINYIRNNLDKINIEKEKNKIFEKNKLNTENLELKLLKLFFKEINIILENNKNNLKNNNEKLEIIITEDNKIFVNKSFIQFSNFKKFIEYIVKKEDEETQKKLGHKIRTNILKSIFEYTLRQKRIGKARVDLVEIDLDYIERKIDLLEKKDTKNEYKYTNYLKNKLLKKEEELNKLQKQLLEKEQQLKQKDDKIAELEEQLERLSIQLENYENESKEKENKPFELYTNDDENANEEVSKEVDEYFNDIDDIPF